MNFSINQLGNNGHLGNQMFQYAFVKGMALKHSREFFIPPNEIFGKFYYQKLFSNIDDAFDLKCNRNCTDYVTVSERFFHFDQELFENPLDENINYLGFFQSEKYFKHIENQIRVDFTFRDEILNPCKEFMSSFDDVIGLHIRRNDFITNPNHPVQDDKYYIDALSEFSDDTSVLVFSDDIEWCKSNKLFDDERFMISETEDAYQDLCLLSLCTHHIICNSTFSWWGAWLANSKNVIAPKNWFGGDCINHNTEDLYLPHWRIIE